MHQIKKDEATLSLRRVLIYLVSDGDGKTAITGIGPDVTELKVSKNGAAEANMAGLWTEISGGLYHYELATGEIDTFGFVSVRVIPRTSLRVGGVDNFRTFVKEVQIIAASPYVLNGIPKN